MDAALRCGQLYVHAIFVACRAVQQASLADKSLSNGNDALEQRCAADVSILEQETAGKAEAFQNLVRVQQAQHPGQPLCAAVVAAAGQYAKK